MVWLRILTIVAILFIGFGPVPRTQIKAERADRARRSRWLFVTLALACALITWAWVYLRAPHWFVELGPAMLIVIGQARPGMQTAQQHNPQVSRGSAVLEEMHAGNRALLVLMISVGLTFLAAAVSAV